ncbi:MAG: GNAT family N-acetyltransferase [Lentisphaerae bacterium]|nr:GNAT family N-acetyltransferase [Lentisphaerota bacterium]
MDIRQLASSEQQLILPLWEVCFPDFWEQLAVKNGKIPYEEISFAAFDGNMAVGHCGIIPYTIQCGGKNHMMAGIASVATLPEYRNRGIAKNLCRFAAQWAQNRSFISAPLYTAHFRVYESASWRKLTLPPALQTAAGSGANWKSGSQLTAEEKSCIAEIYAASEVFDGKVLRQVSGTLHSWERIFAEPGFLFTSTDRMYALKADETIIELNALPGTPPAYRKDFFDTLGYRGTVNFHLPETSTVRILLSGREMTTSDRDPMHGELPMVLDFGSKDFHTVNHIFFPAADKF